MQLSRSFSRFVCSKPIIRPLLAPVSISASTSNSYNFSPPKQPHPHYHHYNFTTTRPTMALNPKFAAQRLLFGQPTSAVSGAPPAVHTLELFLDYVCPFSAKQFATFYNSVVPLIKSNPKWASGLEVILRQQVQPWHPSSTLVHEAALAVLRVAPAKYWDFSAALFAAQLEYFDEAVVAEPRNDTYKRLAKLAASSVGADEGQVYDLLAIADKVPEGGHANFGNKVTNDLKLQIRAGRLVGVHVSPTVIFDGVVANDISSSWTKEQWQEWLTKSVV